MYIHHLNKQKELIVRVNYVKLRGCFWTKINQHIENNRSHALDTKFNNTKLQYVIWRGSIQEPNFLYPG